MSNYFKSAALVLQVACGVQLFNNYVAEFTWVRQKTPLRASPPFEFTFWSRRNEHVVVLFRTFFFLHKTLSSPLTPAPTTRPFHNILDNF